MGSLNQGAQYSKQKTKVLSDLGLIQAFVKDSIEGKEVLLSNSSLRAEKIYDVNQLMDKAEGVLLTFKLTDKLPLFRLKGDTSHWEAINQVLVFHHYLLVGEMDSRGFYQYQYVKLPKGYQGNCTKSVLLWRAWWRYRQRIVKGGIPLEMLIRTRGTWYPIRNVECGHGLIYIQTLGQEIQLHSNDLVIWLGKIT